MKNTRNINFIPSNDILPYSEYIITLCRILEAVSNDNKGSTTVATATESVA